MAEEEYVTAVAHVQVRPEFGYWNKNQVVDAHAVRMIQSKPDAPISGTVTVKLKIRIPKAAFKPLEPVAEVTVPLDMVEANQVVEVIAEEAS